jgi:hypothetical protein
LERKMRTAEELLAWADQMGPREGWTSTQEEEYKQRKESLPSSERYFLRSFWKDKRFTPEEAQEDKKWTVSAGGGKWILECTPYTKGVLVEVFRPPVFPEKERVKLAEIRRNYYTFWHFLYENHPADGNDYLLCGEDYQGLTLVNLITGEVRHHFPEEGFKGHGWCTADIERTEDPTILKAVGCFWACPYNIRLLDFSNPDAFSFERGLPDLTEGIFFDEGENVRFSFEGGKIVWQEFEYRFRETGEYETDIQMRRGDDFARELHLAKKREDEAAIAHWKLQEDAFWDKYWGDWEGEGNDPARWELEERHRLVYQRGADGKFVLHEEWKSDRLLAAEKRRMEFNEEDRKRKEAFYESNELMLAVKEAWPDWASRTERWIPSPVSRWEGEENPFRVRILLGKNSAPPHISFGCETGPVELTQKSPQGEVITQKLPRSPESIWRAKREVERQDLLPGE